MTQFVNVSRDLFYFGRVPVARHGGRTSRSLSVAVVVAGWAIFSRKARVGGGGAVTARAPAVVVDSVSKRFRLQHERPASLKEKVTKLRFDRKNEFWALKDVSLAVPSGSMFALVGHNGSGKSTLLRLIAGIYKPTTGKVATVGRISALLELGAGFHPDLTGRENVYLNAAILGMTRKETDRLYGSIVEFSGLEEFVDTPVRHYSSGMYVRLGFAVAVHVDPDILMVDEVIAVGDAEFQRRCYEHFYKLRQKGTTIVIVTHGLGDVKSMCDEAAWLDHGALRAVGAGSRDRHACTSTRSTGPRPTATSAAGCRRAPDHDTTVADMIAIDIGPGAGRRWPARAACSRPTTLSCCRSTTR